MNPTQVKTFDPQVIALSKAIAQHESGMNFQAKGASGEYGVGQWMPDTWNAQAKQVLGYVPAFGTPEMTPDLQKAVLTSSIEQYKNEKLNPAQIAAKWNSGSPTGWENKIGTNSEGVKYNVPAYVKNVTDLYQRYKLQQPNQVPNVSQETPSLYTGFLGTNPNDSLYGNILDNSITRGIEDFFPGRQVGESIGTLAGAGYAKVKDVLTGSKDYQNFNLSTPTPLQVAGDIGQGALTVAMPGAGEGAGVLGRIGSQAVVGAGLSSTGAIAQGSTDIGQIAQQGVQGAVLGGTLGTLGEAVGYGLNKLAQPFAKDLNTGAINSAGKIGLPQSDLPISAITNNKTVRYAESLFNGEKLAEQVDNAQLKLNALANDVLAKTGVSEDLATAGQQIFKGLQDFETNFKNVTSKLYDTFAEKGGNLPVKSYNAVDTLNNIIDAKTAIGESKDLGYFNDKLAVLTGGESKNADFKMPTFNTLKKIRTAVGEKIDTKFQDPFVSQHIGQLKQFYGALTKDMEQTVADTGNPKIIQALQRANDAYKAGRTVLSTEYAKTIQRLASNGQFDRIIPALTSSSKSISNIPALLEVIGKDNIPRLQSAILDDIFTKAQTLESGFTEKGISKMINKYGEDRLNALLTPQQNAFLKDLDNVSKALAQAEKISKGSQTAFLSKTFGKMFFGVSAIKELLTGNIGGALTNLAPVLGESVAKAFLNSNIGRDIITKGFELNKNIIPLVRQATKAVTVQSTK